MSQLALNDFPLPDFALPATANGKNGEANKVLVQDRAAHEWYRFVLSYPPHIVRQYLERFGVGEGQRVLDPFSGTGTTVVECKKLGIEGIGIEANPVAHFAGQVKTDWTPDPEGFAAHADQIAEAASAKLRTGGLNEDPILLMEPKSSYPLRGLAESVAALLLTDSISPVPLHKTLILLETIDELRDERYWRHARLALAKALVFKISNLHFGPEVGVGKPKADAPVVALWREAVGAMTDDLRVLRLLPATPSSIHHADARHLLNVLEPNSIDAVITSPPYPNEKDYTRTTRLEFVLLGFVHSKADLQALKRGLVRSNTRGVYKADDDDRWVSDHPEITRIADAIEARRIAMGKTSGFERLYARVTKLYFGGMARHLAELRTALRPGARLAYVVGDQASYLRIMIRTGQLLADIALSLGYEVEGIDLFRTRLATATKEQLREEVVVLRWPGKP